MINAFTLNFKRHTSVSFCLAAQKKHMEAEYVVWDSDAGAQIPTTLVASITKVKIVQ